MIKNDNACEFKNISTSVNTLVVSGDNIDIVCSEIKKIKRKIASFFKTAPVIIDFEGFQVSSADTVKDIFEFTKAEGFMVVGVKNLKEKYKKILKEEGVIPVFPNSAVGSNQVEEAPKKEVAVEVDNTPAVIDEKPVIESVKVEEGLDCNNQTMKIFNVVRRGQQIINKYGDILLFSKLSVGSEIAAKGSIVITDLAEGKVFAGIPLYDDEGDSSATIYIEKFRPVVVSINGIYKHFEDISENLLNKRVLITLDNDKLIVNPLDA